MPGAADTRPDTNAISISTPICANSGSLSVIRLSTAAIPSPSADAILDTSPSAAMTALEKSVRIGMPSAARVSRNGNAISDAAFFSPSMPADSTCSLSLNTPSLVTASSDKTKPICSASSPSRLNASDPAPITLLSSWADFPNSCIANASLSVSFCTFPSASIVSQYTSLLSRNLPFASTTDIPKALYASAYASDPFRALSIDLIFFAIDLVSVSISTSMNRAA